MTVKVKRFAHFVALLTTVSWQSKFIKLSFQEKEAELEMMRKGRKDQRDFFKKMESGQLDEKPSAHREKRLVRNIKDVNALRTRFSSDWRSS